MFRVKKKGEQPAHRSRWKKAMTRVAALGLAVMSFAPSVVSASNSYFLTFTFNPDTAMIVPGTTLSEVGNGVENHAETDEFMGEYYLNGKDVGRLFELNGGGGVPSFDLPEDDALGTIQSSFLEESADSELKYTLPFSFPGRHVGTGAGGGLGDGDTAREASASDQAQAQWVGEQLTNGFNRVFSQAHHAAYSSKKERTESKNLATTAAKIANAADNTGSVTFGDVTFTFAIPGDGEISSKNSDIPKSYYRVVTISGGGNPTTSMTVPVKVPKGYKVDQRMYSRIKGTPYYNEGHHEEDVTFISWQHMVLQAISNASKGVMVTDVENLNPPGLVEGIIAGMFGKIPGAIRGFLGLEPITDLIFNKGMHGDGSIHGTMPAPMGVVADMVFFLMMIVAGFILLGSFVSLLIKSNLSVVNPQMRVDLKDGLITIIGSFFILLIFQPIWSSLMKLNSSLVEFFFHISSDVSNVGDLLVSGSGGIAWVILSIAFLVVEIWFNFYYIVRALTIMVLYMFAPLMIISMAYGGKYKLIFSNWSKELLGALFIQSIHSAILGAISAGLSRGMARSMLWQFVILISLIPLSNMFRKTILSLGGDSIGQTAGRAEKAAMMTGAVGAGLMMKGASAVGGKGLEAITAAGGGANAVTSARSGSGGGGGTGTKSTQTKLGDGPQDLSDNPLRTSESLNPDSKKDMSFKEMASTSLQNVAQNDKVQKMAQWAQSDKLLGGATLAAGASAVARGLLSAGTVVGDMATEGDSHSAFITASQMNRKGGGKGGRGGKGASNNYSASEDLQAIKPPANKLKRLSEAGKVGDQGALTIQNTADGKTMTTFDRKHLNEETGISDITTVGADSNFRSGITRITHSGENLSDKNKAALDYASNLNRKISQGTASEHEIKAYAMLQETTQFAGVKKMEDGSYIASINNDSNNWDATAVDDDHFMLKADSMVDKHLPNFTKDNDAATADLRRWYKEVQGGASQSDSSDGQQAAEA